MSSKDIQELINKALALKETDIDASKALILTAKTLFPQNFEIFFTDYQLQKASGNCHEAAKSFSYIVLFFDNPEILEEIKVLVNALKMADKNEKISQEAEFYVNMFQYFANGPAGQKIIMLLNSDSDSDFTYIRIMKKFSKNFNLSIHAPRLLEKILTGISVSPNESTELLVREVLPLMMNEQNIELPVDLVNHVLDIVFKYYIAKFWDSSDIKPHVIEQSRASIIELFEWVGKLLKWEPFQYNPSWTKDFFWQKLKQIENVACDVKQIFYLTCFLFFVSVQDYLSSTKLKIDSQDVQFILVDGLSDLMESPPLMNILHESPFPSEAAVSFVTAFKAQDLLQRNVIFFKDFNQLLFDLNITRHINRIVVDFAIYLRSNTDSYNLINNSKLSNLEKNIRMLSLVINAPNTTREVFDHIRLIMTDLPTISGVFLKNLACDRSFLFLPLTRNAIVQYCTRIIISALKRKLFKDPTKVDDYQLGSLLVLLQLEFYENIPLVEHIFEIIRVKGLDFPLFHSFIINIDMIEEFMNLWRGHEVILRLSSSTSTPSTQRRIGTRGADKNVKEDFKQIIKQQVLRSGEDVVSLVIQFIEQENLNLLQNLTTF
ncbi:CLUMA_CG001282, isoform A [Clunio marinus]|uniref:Integrator complex subunit 10 n=1 Tax=Clunio marinus TaxID=568069 RepID=A0A1J1HML7_9DIPT|nr:CLUMA_CG001282, isoform A [Clunio marinus]